MAMAVGLALLGVPWISSAQVPDDEVAPATTGVSGDVPDHFRIHVGTVFSGHDTNFSIAAPDGGFGGLINFEDLLGVDGSSSSIRIGGSWRFNRRSSLIFDYHLYDRSGDRVPQREFTFLRWTIPAGVATSTELETELTTVAYRYDAYNSDEVRLYGLAGISYFRIDARLAAGIGVLGPGGDPIGRGIDESVSIHAPVPIIGVGTEWAATRRLRVNLFFQGLWVDLGDYRGDVTEAGLTGTWYFLRNLGFGMGFSRTDIRVREYQDDDFKARGAYSRLGFAVFLETAF